MIAHDARYHWNYLKGLRPIRSGHFDNEVLNDGYQRVSVSRMTQADGEPADNMVRIESVDRGTVTAEYPAETGPLYCKPHNAGLCSESKAVARRLSTLLSELERLDTNLVDGEITDDLRDLRLKIHNRLLAEGWRISATDNGWKVLQPLTGKRNDNHERGNR